MDIIKFDTKTTSLIFLCGDALPALIYWGPYLAEQSELRLLPLLHQRQEAPASARDDPPTSLSPNYGEGFTGQIGLQVHRQGFAWAPVFTFQDIKRSPTSLVFRSVDSAQGMVLEHHFEFDIGNDLFTCHSKLINTHQDPLNVEWCAAPCIPVAETFADITAFEGRWAKEFQRVNQRRQSGVYLRENRKGRTSHDSFPALLLASSGASDTQGKVLAFHLAWSGNHRICVDQQHNNRAHALFGELLLPGEICLSKAESYSSPKLYASYSQEGFNGISQRFYGHIRHNILSDALKRSPRPVHFNTWEALYFDHDAEKLQALVAAAKKLGAERFILDDGWFKGRRDDTAGLGDWFVDEAVYPRGLGPLIEQVKQAGMQFGLWFEPEMVNPDSDLYRAHPDWVLQVPHAKTILARSQLVLNLSHHEVRDYLFQRLSALLNTYPIDYIKWDMNRDIQHAGDSEGRPAIHKQTLALYALIAAIKRAFPHLEIESCASGGGRADLGILAHTDRIWTSDSNDAMDRLSIQRGFSLFFPPEIMGSHVGPQRCHITGRDLPMETRVASALFGHMGMEVNLLTLDDASKATLQKGIALHKQLRDWLHAGTIYRFNTNSYSDTFAVFSQSKEQAVYSYAYLDSHNKTQDSIFYFAGLEGSAQYSVAIIWPDASPRYRHLEERLQDKYFAGEFLLHHGLQLPLMLPQTTLLFHVRRKL